MTHATAPALPSLSQEEFRRRWQALGRLMERDRLDLLLVYGDDHALFGQANVRYLADFPVHFEPALVLLSPRHDPVLATGPETIGHAELVARTPTVTAIREFSVPILEYPGLEMPYLRDLIRDSFGSSKRERVGVVGLDLMSVDHWERIRPAVEPAEVLRLDELLFELRPRKSAEEISIFRYAFKLTEVGFEALLEACRPGAREFEVAAAAEEAMRSRGSEGTAIDTVVASGGDNTRPIIGRTGTRELQAGNPVAITMAPKYQGYGAPIGRLIYLGEAPGDIRHAAETALSAQERAAATLRAGATFAEVDLAARSYLRKHGYDSVYGIGHSCGLQEFEPPYFGPAAPGAVEANFVMSIDIGMFRVPWGGFRLEDAFLVTDDGSEPMTNVQPGLIEVAV